MADEVVEPLLLEINSVDFSGYINRKSYSVQKDDEYTTWVDGNWVTHREIVRTRISGSFNMTFLSKLAYESFINAIAAVKTSGGYCSVKLWVNTAKQLETIDAFLTISTKHVWTTEAYGNDPSVSAVTVKVIQR